MKNKKERIKKTLIFTLVFLLILIPLALYLITSFDNKNIRYRLNIISSYGDKEAYHPKVIAFKEKWNGYKYWMSFTPYPKGKSAKENPHIVASNDLINWEVPKGLKNPLDEVDNIPKKRYNSDSHIVYNPDTKILSCYWRQVDHNKVIIYKRDTKDGVHWRKKEIVIISTDRHKKDYISPAIIYDEGIYKIWYVDVNYKVKYATSEDGLNWVDQKEVNIIYKENLNSWHLDIIKTDKGYEMLVVAFDKWKNLNKMKLYYTYSLNETDFVEAKVVLKPETRMNKWDNSGIYRSSFIYENGKYYVFFGAQSKRNHRGTGLLEGKDLFNLNSINPKKYKKYNKQHNNSTTKHQIKTCPSIKFTN